MCAEERAAGDGSTLVWPAPDVLTAELPVVGRHGDPHVVGTLGSQELGEQGVDDQDAVGYQAHNPDGKEQPEIVLNELVHAVKATGGIGVVGVYLPQDPGAENELAKEGKLAFDYGTFFFKGQSMGTGQCNTKAYNARLRDLITAGRANPGFLVSHELPLDQAVHGYDQFDKRVDGWTKVVLHPGQAA